MVESETYFVGKDSYLPSVEVDKGFLLKLIDEVRDVLKEGIKKLKNITEFEPKISLEINKNDPSFYFGLRYFNVELQLTNSVRENIEHEIHETCETAWKLIEEALRRQEFYPELGRGSISFTLQIRPIRGHYVCPICKERIEDSEVNYVFCSLTKENIAACITQNHEVFFVENVIDKEIDTKNYLAIDKDLKVHILDPRKRVHCLLAWQLNKLAKNEEHSFLTPDIENLNPKIYVLTHKGIPIGYAFWNDCFEGICLRQIFTRKEYRRKGFATNLMEKTVEIECGKKGEFYCESPNVKSQGILIKLGHAKVEDGKLVGIRCSLVHDVKSLILPFHQKFCQRF